MEGTQNSLNVAVALSVLAYEAYIKRKEKKRNGGKLMWKC